MERLDKLLANTGRWSRREARELVRQGRVTVDGAAAAAPEEKYEAGACFAVDGEIISGEKRAALINRVMAVVFLAGLFLGSVATFAVPKPAFSEDENKYLADFPRFSVSSIRSKKFMTGFEDYAADHFPARSAWIGMQTRFQLLLGQREINGVYVLKDRLLERVDPPTGKNVANSVLAMSQFAERFDGTTYLMLIPTAAEIYRDRLPTGAPTLSERVTIDEVYKRSRTSPPWTPTPP